MFRTTSRKLAWVFTRLGNSKGVNQFRSCSQCLCTRSPPNVCKAKDHCSTQKKCSSPMPQPRSYYLTIEDGRCVPFVLTNDAVETWVTGEDLKLRRDGSLSHILRPSSCGRQEPTRISTAGSECVDKLKNPGHSYPVAIRTG